ncbi:hypothetical protein ASPZODRAFT_722770 [Penicilliopsis zonata CBS 506.65]|uniref:Uncharacterized protein n=1 Tax=Penicilliopsis zonata CBS 506.65 TaxID=1073090 RepID=A0A1L9SBX6_9EURO|nr:hypothetical protein ASPZODRAFT_722770 [Penicilliopsis zonata CBS 506.65]OJJ44710.1 hypothetical protein ASPZODRAFT_722770 [Penicilliopsis zonata CBS 506.65]
MDRSLALKERWVHTWTAMPMLTEPEHFPPKPFVQDAAIFPNTTIRQTVRISIGTQQSLRLRVSNAFGAHNLTITEATVALAASNQSGTNAIQPGSVRNVTFGAERDITIPPGALGVSDPIHLGVSLPARTALSISLFLKDGQGGGQITSHPGSRTTSYFAFGNRVSDVAFADDSVKTAIHWWTIRYYISGVEVFVSRPSRALALIGDSITDGLGSVTNGDTRWPDLLFVRLQKHPRTEGIAVLNSAAGGNRILQDGTGPSLLSRLDRDILAVSGVESVLIFSGVNDIGVAAAEPAVQEDLAKGMIAALRQIVTRLHAQGISVYGATITPFGRLPTSLDKIDSEEGVTPYSNPVRETTRQKVNDFIRSSGVFDAVVDFDRVLSDPLVPYGLASEYDSGDHLHPNQRAFQALADAIPLDLLKGSN